MASSKPIPCGPCQQALVNIDADIWCYNCDEGLCSTCTCHHKRSKGTCGHKTVDMKNYKPSNIDIKTECDKHGQQFLLYCPSHLMPCCDVCISMTHANCTGIKSLASVVETTNIEKSKTVERDINCILSFLDQLVNNTSKNIRTGEHQYISIKKSIGEIRREINKHLDHLEENLCQEADTIWNQEKSKATDFIFEIEQQKQNLEKIKEHLQTVTTHTSKLQSFLGVHHIEQQVHQCQRFVDDLDNDERTKEFDIRIKQNDEIEKIITKLLSIETLAEVMVMKTKTDLNRGTSVRRKVQVELPEQSNINNITMNIETKIGMNIQKLIREMICLIDGRIIMVENTGKVHLLTPDGKHRKELQISVETDGQSVTQISHNTIAIAYPYEQTIRIFNMENERFTEVIKLNKGCICLSFSLNCLAVGVNPNEICITDLEGTIMETIKVRNFGFGCSLVYCNDRLIYSSHVNGNAVYCYDGSGDKIWQYEQDLFVPEGLCIDSSGNTIVIDGESHRIIVIAKDGKHSKVLIKDGLTSPHRIDFKHNESSGFICNHAGTILVKFNLCYG